MSLYERSIVVFLWYLSCKVASIQVRSKQNQQILTMKFSNSEFVYLHTGLVKKRFRRLEGFGIKSMWAIYKTKVLIYLSKANLEEKIFVW